MHTPFSMVEGYKNQFNRHVWVRVAQVSVCVYAHVCVRVEWATTVQFLITFHVLLITSPQLGRRANDVCPSIRASEVQGEY